MCVSTHVVNKDLYIMAYLAHEATDVWSVSVVCLTVKPSFSDIADVPTIGHNFKTDRIINPHLLISRRAVRRRHYRQRIKSQKTARSVVRVEPTTFRTAVTNDDWDKRIYWKGHRDLLIFFILAPLIGAQRSQAGLLVCRISVIWGILGPLRSSPL